MPGKRWGTLVLAAWGLLTATASPAEGPGDQPLTTTQDYLRFQETSSAAPVVLGNFDWHPGNTLLKGAASVGVYPDEPGPVTIYHQSRLAGILDQHDLAPFCDCSNANRAAPNAPTCCGSGGTSGM